MCTTRILFAVGCVGAMALGVLVVPPRRSITRHLQATVTRHLQATVTLTVTDTTPGTAARRVGLGRAVTVLRIRDREARTPHLARAIRGSKWLQVPFC